MPKDQICSRCGEYLGETNDLEVCPICGQLICGYRLEEEYGFGYDVYDFEE